MRTPATTAAITAMRSGRILALVGVELRTVLRNRALAVSSILVPIGIGAFWGLTFRGVGGPQSYAAVIALQLAVVLGMGVYVTATQTLVSRRQSRVLKRMRTTGLSDGDLLAATVLPSVVLGLPQLAVFSVINALAGAPFPADPLPLVIAVLGGLALAISAGPATSIVTPSPERAQITTLPLVFGMLATAVVLAIAPPGSWLQALVVVPGAAVGQLAQLAMTGATFAPGLAGLPAALPGTLALVVWPVVFGVLALRRFRWDPRH